MLAAQIGDDSVLKLEKASSERFVDAECLANRGGKLAAIYLYGYVIEMRIKAAYFRMEGHAGNQPITRQDRSIAEAHARSLGITFQGPHDFAHWAIYLVSFDGTRPRPIYAQAFGQEMVNRARAAYQDWGPSLRYRSLVPSASEVENLRSGAIWFSRNYFCMA